MVVLPEPRCSDGRWRRLARLRPVPIFGVVVLSAVTLAAALASGREAESDGRALLNLRLRPPLLGGRENLTDDSSDADALAGQHLHAITVVVERDMVSRLENATVQALDKLMRKDPFKYITAGVEYTEKTDEPNLFYTYYKKSHLGPYLHQIRLLCKSEMRRSGRIDLDILGIDIGLAKGWSRHIVFKRYDERVDIKWENSITWEPASKVGGAQGVRLRHRSRGTFRIVMPWWFPLPNVVTKMSIKFMIKAILKEGQAKVVKVISDEFAEDPH